MVGIRSVEQRHAILTTCNQGVFASELLQQLASCCFQRWFVGNGSPGKQFRLALIGRNHGNRPVLIGVVNFGIDEHGDRGTARLGQYAVEHAPVNDTLVVVGHDNGGCRGKVPQKRGYEFGCQNG